MARSSQSAVQAIIFGIILLSSFFNIVSTTPLPEKNNSNFIVARDSLQKITEIRYQKYMLKYFPDTDHYIFYTGRSRDQAINFMVLNSRYRT